MEPLSGRHGVKRSRIRSRWILAAVVSGFLVASSVGARGGDATETGQTLSERGQAWLQNNPALEHVAVAAPEMLPEILEKLAFALDNPSTSRGSLVQLEPDAAELLESNPALMQAWRSSPEASADLLELIRIAAGGGKPRK